MVAQLMMSQQRFFQRMSEQTGARRELRNTLGTLPTELRGLSTVAGDVVAFGASSLTFRSTIGTAFVCDRPSSTSVDVPPVNTARTSTSNWVTLPSPGDTIFALRHDSSGVVGDYWSAHRITAVTTGAGYCLTSPYTDPVLDAGKARVRFVVSPAFPDSVVSGSALRFTRTARYELAQQTSGRWYLQRQELQAGSWTVPVVLSGPYVPPRTGGFSGVALTYFDSTGASVPVGGDSRNIARIDVALRTQGRTGSAPGAGPVIDSVQLSIAVRNRR